MSRLGSGASWPRRAWAGGLAVWALGLAWFYGGDRVAGLCSPSRLEFRIGLLADDARALACEVTATGRARDIVAAHLGGSAAASGSVASRNAPAGDDSRTFAFVPRTAGGAPRDSAVRGVRAVAGKDLLLAGDDLRDFPAGVAIETGPDAAALWVDDEVHWPPADAASEWRVDRGDLRRLDAGLLLVAPECRRIAGVEELVCLAQRADELLAAADGWRAELDQVLPRPGGKRTVVAVHVPPDHPSIAPRFGSDHVLIPVGGVDARARESFLELLCASRLRADGPLPDEDAWLDPAIARRTALALCTPDRAEGRWRDVLAYRVFLESSYEAPLRSLRGLDDRAYDYVARLKGPQFLRVLEAAGAPRDEPDFARAWVAVRHEVAAGNPLGAAVARAFGSASGAECARLDDGDAPLGLAPIGRDLVLSPAPVPAPSGPATDEWTIALSADTENFLETCGCRLRQAGGIARKARLLARFREEGPTLAVDLGNVFPRVPIEDFDANAQGEVRLQLEADRRMGYALHVLGSNELYVGLARLRACTDAFRAANATSGIADDAPWSREPLVVDLHGTRARLIAICASTPYWIDPDEWRRRTAGVEVEDPVAAVRRAARDAPPEDLLVVAGALPTWRIAELVAAVPDIDLVLTSDRRVLAQSPGAKQSGNPRRLASGFVGPTLVVLANEESHGLVRAQIRFGEHGRIRSFQQESILLAPDLEEDPGVRALLDDFYAGQTAQGSGALTPVAMFDAERGLAERAPDAAGAGYVGSAACRSCHPADYERWLATPHAGAYQTLEEKHRARSPDCLRCHVVGLGLPGGFPASDPAPPAGLRGVGCEVCHGPGRAHAVERPGERNAIRRGLDRRQCEACHDAEHSEPLSGRREDPFGIGAHRSGTPTADASTSGGAR